MYVWYIGAWAWAIISNIGGLHDIISRAAAKFIPEEYCWVGSKQTG